MSIEKITSAILAEAEAAEKAALEEAQAKCDKIIAEAREKAQAQKEATIQKGREEKEKIVLRRRSVAAIDSKKAILEKKQEVISDCFDQVVERIAELPRGEYIDFLVRVGLASNMPGGQLFFNEKERDSIAEEVTARLNEATAQLRKAEGRDFPESERFTLSSDNEPVRGGYWIRYGQTYADDTVESQVSVHKKELAAEVSRMLFED